MWISKYEYEHMQAEIKKLNAKANMFDSIMDAISNLSFSDRPALVIKENIYVISKAAFDATWKKIDDAEHEVLELTAERDWYKNAYAELKCRQQD